MLMLLTRIVPNSNIKTVLASICFKKGQFLHHSRKLVKIRFNQGACTKMKSWAPPVKVSGGGGEAKGAWKELLCEFSLRKGKEQH